LNPSVSSSSILIELTFCWFKRVSISLSCCVHCLAISIKDSYQYFLFSFFSGSFNDTFRLETVRRKSVRCHSLRFSEAVFLNGKSSVIYTTGGVLFYSVLSLFLFDFHQSFCLLFHLYCCFVVEIVQRDNITVLCILFH
jgi:hypothetical protein